MDHNPGPPPAPPAGGGGLPLGRVRLPQRNSGGLKLVSMTLPVATEGQGQMINITPDLSRLLKSSGMSEGNVTIFVPGSTASVTTIEFEPGLKHDFPAAMERVAPVNAEYKHDQTWHDGNGHSHVRASLVGPSLVIPFGGGRLLTGNWQQVVLVDWDNRARRRELILQFIGE